jgi:hypothetical protein
MALESAFLKVERAEKHIRDLEGELEAFIARKPHRFIVKNDVKTGQPIIQIRIVEEPPKIFSVIIGDAVHNLRSALDHMVWELVGRDGGKQDERLAFPCSKTRDKFEVAIDKIETPSLWIKQSLKRVEAFKGGAGEVFFILNLLDAADKHRIVQPIMRASQIPAFTVYAPNGKIVIRMENCTIADSGPGDSFPIGNIPPGGHVELDGDTDCPPDIFLPETPFPTQAVIALKSFAGAVKRVLEDIYDKGCSELLF